MARFCSEGIWCKRVVTVGVAVERACAGGYEGVVRLYGFMGSDDVLSHCCSGVHWLPACAEGL